MTQRAIPCAVMRGGTSKGLYFLRRDLPSEIAKRDVVLLAAMGSPDPREIDGMGGAHPLTSKVAVVGPSGRPDADVDYLFLQVWPDRPEVSDSQNCGNLLAGVGPFAIETGLVDAASGQTDVRIWMQNTDSLATAHVSTPGGVLSYEGQASIDGVPGTHAPIVLDFIGIAGSSCGTLLPTGNVADEVCGVRVTCIDNGMPVVCVRAADLGVSGNESPRELEADDQLRTKVEAIRLECGVRMGLGDVANKTVPKVSLLSRPVNGGMISTRTFIPHRVHDSIGVLGAVSVATACLIPGSVAAGLAAVVQGGSDVAAEVEHPTGRFTVELDVELAGAEVTVHRAGLIRTARMLMRGDVYVPASKWTP